ncbi:MAG: hypothetical protein Q8S32_04430 [Burkholderiaceae bacterium]|nr:hypothetical protein [Burkholderiaceae bacterium]
MRSKLWLALCMLHAVASMLVWWAGDPLAWQATWRADHWVQRPWTLWTSAWVHMNTPHLIGNQLAVGALAAMAWLLKPHAGAGAAWLLSWPLMVLCLPLWPQIGHYAGLSGLVHAAVAIVGLHLVLGEMRIRKAQRWGGMLLLGLATKLGLEGAWHWPVVWSDASDMSIVQAAHLAGAAVGLVAAGLTLRRHPWMHWVPSR